MANLVKAEKLIDDFLQHAPFSGNLEKGFFEYSGNDAFLLLNNGFSFENLTHDEILRMTVLLTREMKAEINNDLKYFWAFSSYITYRQNEKLFMDLDWRSAFCLLINLVLSSKRHPEIMTSDAKSILRAQEEFDRLLSRGVNAHFLEVESKRWELSAPLAFSVLEGLLRRKNEKVVNLNGIAKQNFTIIKSYGKLKPFSIRKTRMNQIDDALDCFEQVTIPKRKRACKHLVELKAELNSFSPQASDIFESISEWRNNLLHGEKYWAPKIPLVLNLICFLMIDEIKPKAYNSKRAEIQTGIKFWLKRRGIPMPEWSLYPPDL